MNSHFFLQKKTRPSIIVLSFQDEKFAVFLQEV